MLKLKFNIFIIVLICLILVTIFALIPFGTAQWIKIIIYLLIFSTAYYLINKFVSALFKKATSDIIALQDELKEKRIQAATEEENIVPSELPVLQDLKEKFADILREIEQQQDTGKQKEAMITDLFSQHNNLVHISNEQETARAKDMEKINNNYKTILQNTNKAFTISDNLSSSAKNAFDLSGEVQEEIQNVSTVLQEAAERSDMLFEQSKKISKIIEMINEISAKTHILSINASIVSARAGKDGKAFEVVSKEIRKLATETDKSLNEISEEIGRIQEIIKNVVKGINDANSQTVKERDMLTAVIGALQGVTLGVEVLRAVSNVVNTKTIQQKELIETVFLNYDILIKEIKEFNVTGEQPTLPENAESTLNNLKALIDSFT